MAYYGFNKLKSMVHGRNPGAIVASIGREKYGKKKFQKAAAEGKSLRGAHALRK